MVWVLCALSVPPGAGLSVLAQFAVAALACAAFSLLLGQAGLLSFGHALYAGLGSWAAVQLLRAMAEGQIWAGTGLVVLVPLLAGLAAALAAALLGAANARRGGTAFAMISLGLSEAVWFVAQATPAVFGGEGGLSANRVQGAPFGGVSLGPEREVVVLMGLYMLGGLALMRRFALSRAGLLLRALRDDPQRLEFLGVGAPSLRWLALVISAFFMGVSGGMAALWTEVFTTESLHASRSGLLLVFTVLGGVTVLLGPVLGAALMAAALVWLPGVSQGWMWLVGLLFVSVVWAQPRGLAGVIGDGLTAARQGRSTDFWPALMARLAAGIVTLSGGLGLLEMGYHLPLADTLGPQVQLLGVVLRVDRVDSWVGCAVMLVLGGVLWWAMRRPQSEAALVGSP